MADCINACESEIIFEVKFKDGAIENHCADCLSNLFKEDPDQIVSLKRI